MSVPMSLNEACLHLLYYLQSMEEDHGSILDIIIKEYAGEDVEAERGYYTKAMNALRNFKERGRATIEIDPDWESSDLKIVKKPEEPKP